MKMASMSKVMGKPWWFFRSPKAKTPRMAPALPLAADRPWHVDRYL